jgi:hypothetical protein
MDWIRSPGFMLAGGVVSAIALLAFATHLGGAW